jgi:hypothetical protein
VACGCVRPRVLALAASFRLAKRYAGNAAAAAKEPQLLGQLVVPAAVSQDPSRVVAQEQSPASPNHCRCGLAATVSPPRWLGRQTARVCRLPRPPSGTLYLTSR